MFIHRRLNDHHYSSVLHSVNSVHIITLHAKSLIMHIKSRVMQTIFYGQIGCQVFNRKLYTQYITLTVIVLYVCITRQGCQPFFLPPCQKTYECSTRNSKVPRCLEDSCTPMEMNTKSFRPNGIGFNAKTLSKYYSNNISTLHCFCTLNRFTYTITCRYGPTELSNCKCINYIILVSDYISFPRENSVNIMRDLMDNGPLQISMHMYEDFRVYTKGNVLPYRLVYYCGTNITIFGNIRKYLVYFFFVQSCFNSNETFGSGVTEFLILEFEKVFKQFKTIFRNLTYF